MSVASPSRAAFPGSQAGRHPRLHFRGLLRLHSNYGPLDRSTAQGGLCHRASIHPVTRTNRLPATRSNRPVWVVPSSTSDTRLLGARGVEERRGGLGPMGITPFPLPAHQTGRADFPHPASRPASPQGTRRWAKMDPTSPNTTVSGKPGATRRHLMAPDQEMTYSLVRSSSLIPDNQFGSPAPPSP